MADKNDSGDKTEKPTPKKLEDARKKGDVAKSKEVTSTVVLVAWIGLGALVIGYAGGRIAGLCEALFTVVGQGWETTGYAGAVRSLGGQAFELLLLIIAILLVPIAAIGLLTDFLQTGPILTFEKIKPKLDALNPVEGVKKMFSMDNLIELIKNVLKAALLFALGWIIIKSSIPDIVALTHAPAAGAQAIGSVIWSITLKLLAYTAGLFVLVAVLDAAYQRYSFTKKMRMSLRDIKQEMKESEGDPYVKGQRRQLQQEWAQRNQTNAARNANVLLVNPTHIAIAIDYNEESCPIPTISAKGEDHVARAMREAAEEAGVPIVRNIPLARDLFARGEVGEIIPSDVFDVIAEVILWARDVRKELEAERNHDLAAIPQRRRAKPPGEDLTRYPDKPWNRSH
ncbi:MAG TPA: type III secretion system export apparatus subunit SctU [Burkholderiaceae bacterium]|nr:type III secretion system export apparatus subunit SctU [Burkholderiaceae bacterium]